MSTSKVQLRSVPYRIDAQSPVVEIYLLDKNLSVKNRGLGVLEGDAQPGIYKVKFKSGAAFVQKFFDLTEPVMGNTPIRLALDPGDLSLSTPVPIDGTATSHEYHRGPAEQLSREVHKKLGSGSQIFVFVRDQGKEFTGSPAESLRLLDTSENVLAVLAELGGGDDPNSIESWHGCNLEVDPGTYLLQCQIGEDRKLFLPVVTCKGNQEWQTQVFLFRATSDQNSDPRPQLNEAGVLMVPSGMGFTSSGTDHLKWSELARKSLAQGKAFDAPKDAFIRDLISLKLEDPMLGIYAAHCLMMRPGADTDLLATITRNLGSLLGRHPDVDSIKLELGADPAAFRYDVPPMLRRSWSTVVSTSFEHPDIIPEDSLASRAADRTWGEGAWFVWHEESKPAEMDRGASNLSAPLTITEDAVYQYCVNRKRGERFESGIASKTAQPLADATLGIRDIPLELSDLFVDLQPNAKPDTSQFSDKQVAQTLGLPRSAVQRALLGLRSKLK